MTIVLGATVTVLILVATVVLLSKLAPKPPSIGAQVTHPVFGEGYVVQVNAAPYMQVALVKFKNGPLQWVSFDGLALVHREAAWQDVT